jgi:dTDP-4-dehydrorhamnose reductase
MKIVVTGASGQLTRSLCERAVKYPGIELVVVGRPELDFETDDAPFDSIGDFAPDAVINTAAYTAVDSAEDETDRAFKVNARAAGKLAAATERIGAAIVQISTDYVFDGTRTGAYSETSPVAPLGVYGRSKLAGEEEVRAANPRHAIVRTAWVYSPFGRNFVKSIIGAAQTGNTLKVVNDQHGCPTSALDLADGLLTMLVAGGGWGETYHLAGQGPVSWFELAQEVMSQCEKLGLPHVPVAPVTTADWPTRARRPRNSVLDSSKFERAFDFTMPAWRNSVRLVIERLARPDAA